MTKRSVAALSPEAREIVRLQRALSQSGPSRRQVLSGAGALGLGAFLAACGTSGQSSGSPREPGGHDMRHGSVED